LHWLPALLPPVGMVNSLWLASAPTQRSNAAKSSLLSNHFSSPTFLVGW
jgi:hypothetical protein